MPFDSSRAPDISESIPAAISARGVAETYQNAGIAYDVAVAGLPFILAAAKDRPYQRATADQRTQQIDTSKEPGEQSLSNEAWWRRSQDSWHRGEGITFYEPGSDEGTQYRYGHAVGVDVWTKGQVTLLHRMDRIAAVALGQTCSVATGPAGAFYTLENGVLKRRTNAGSVTYSNSGVAPATNPTVAGASILVGHASGIDVGTSAGTTLTRLYDNTGGVVIRPWWAKSRIIATRGADLFELPINNGGSTALPAALYTHPLSSWTWSAVSDSPGAILAAGYSDGISAIYKFALTDASSGSTPKLGQAYQVAEFPPGEQVTAMRVYLGQYVAIGTSRGIRVGLVDDQGSVQYGPLIVETDSPVLDFAARDSYIYAAVTNAIDGMSGAVRINLGEEIESLRYAYAWDAQTHVSGTCTSIAFVGNTDQVVLGVAGDGVYLSSATFYENTGYVTSGRIRFATSELKRFQRARLNVRASGTGVGVSLFFVDNRGTSDYVFTVTEQTGDGVDLALNHDTPIPNAQVTLRLEASDDLLTTPTLDSVLLKALPQVRRQRLIRYPLLCMDHEADRYGKKVAVKGGAFARLSALEELESSSATVLIQDFRVGDTYEAQIESIEYVSTTPADKQSSGFGGFLNITCRRLV